MGRGNGLIPHRNNIALSIVQITGVAAVAPNGLATPKPAASAFGVVFVGVDPADLARLHHKTGWEEKVLLLVSGVDFPAG